MTQAYRLRGHLGLLALMLGGCALTPGSQPATPIDGAWTYEVPGTACIEKYVFKDGTRTFSSSAEHGTSKYLLIHSSDRAGLSQLQDTIVTTNGGTDCLGGGGAPVGDIVTVYLRFTEANDQMLMCRTVDQQSCFGPFKRVTDE